MGFYRNHVFARLMDWVLGRPQMQRERALALADAHGEVLEIGFGTGLNLPHYPGAVTRLHVVDPEAALERRLAARIASVPFPVERRQLAAERLPYADASFDSVVSTWTLCTIPDTAAALAEVGRVLRPGGAYLFLEHGRSDDARVARWQDRLNPLQRLICCGCNINRPIAKLIGASGLAVTALERYTLVGQPRIAAEMYRGQARRAA